MASIQDWKIDREMFIVILHYDLRKCEISIITDVMSK